VNRSGRCSGTLRTVVGVDDVLCLPVVDVDDEHAPRTRRQHTATIAEPAEPRTLTRSRR
jgi:hypothetical protein